MSVRVTSGAELVAWFEGKVREIDKASQETLEDAVEAGANITKHHIETRGTEGTGKRGRIETGKMLNSVSSEVKIYPNEAIGRFGWLEKTPPWAMYQELGTQHIEPMYALADAAEEVRLDYLPRIAGVVRKV